MIVTLIFVITVMLGIALSGITASAADGEACAVCGTVDCINCTHLDPAATHDYDESNNMCSVCGYVPAYRITDEDYNVTFDDSIQSIVVNSKVVVLRDVQKTGDTNNYIEIRDSELDLNGFTVTAFVNTYGDVTITDHSYWKTARIDGVISNFGKELKISACTLSENVIIAVAGEVNASVVLNGVTVENPEFDHPSNTAGSIKVIRGEFPNGIKLLTPIKDILVENGFVMDSEENRIALTDLDTEISGAVSVRTDFAYLSVEGEDDVYFSDITELSPAASAAGTAKITLISDVSFPNEEELKAENGATVTLDINGKSTENLQLYAKTGSKLIITDSSEGQVGVINTIPGITTGYSDGGELIIEGGNYYASTVARDGGKIIIRGGNIYSPSFSIEDGSVEVTGGAFYDRVNFDIYPSAPETSYVLISGGSFDGISCDDRHVYEFLAENYLPLVEDGSFISEDSIISIINEPFTVVYHVHSYEDGFDDVYHWSVCSCGNYDPENQQEEHFGGTATCDNAKTCEGCGNPYGEPLGHDYEYTYSENGTHSKTCLNDSTHTGEEPCTTDTSALLCGSELICDFCGTEYGVLEHNFDGEYISQDGKHFKECTNFECDVTSTPENCTPGTPATCTEAQKCTVCDGVLVSALGHTEGTPATCTELAVCSVCEESYGEPNGHDYDGYACTVCDDELAIKAVFDSYDVIYFDSLGDILNSMLSQVYEYKNLEIILRENIDEGLTSSSTGLYFSGGNVTLDLAGYQLTNFKSLNLGANVTIKDSSKAKTGAITAPESSDYIIMNYNGRLTIEGGSLTGSIISASVAGDTALDILGGSISGAVQLSDTVLTVRGGTFTDTVFTLYTMGAAGNVTRVYGGKFKNIIVTNDTDDATLGDIFSDAECITYLDDAGAALTLDFDSAASYSGTFTVSHDDEHIDRASYEKDYFAHWSECVNGVRSEAEPHEFGEGITCAVCGKDAPYIVTVGKEKFAFTDISEALDKLIKADGGKLTLYTDAWYSSIMPITYNIKGANVTVDLNGNNLEAYIGFYLTDGASLTIEDSSTEKDGVFVIAGDVDLYGSYLFLRDVTVGAYLDLYVYEYSYVNFDGVVLSAELFLEIYGSTFTVTEAEFNSIEVIGAYLRELFWLECMICLDSEGNPLMFESEASVYEGSFTVAHNEDYLDNGIIISDKNGYHYDGCLVCGLKENFTACSGGKAECDVGALCEVCGGEYTEPLGHTLDKDGVCDICDFIAPLVIEVDGKNYYFAYVQDAFRFADGLDSVTITLRGAVSELSENEINIKNAEITLDLAGNSFAFDEINIYGGALIITDSRGGNGTFIVSSTIDVYAGKLVFENVYVPDVNIDLDPEDGAVALYITGGTFDDIDIDTDCDYDYIEIAITGGVFYYVSFDIDDPVDLFITGGEYYYVESIGNYYEYIDDIFCNFDCIYYLDEYGRAVYLPSSYSYDVYFTVKHKALDPESAYEDFDYEYHWYECECGIVIGEKEAHYGGTATCEALAVCEGCGEEYGKYATHSYNEDFVCTECGYEVIANVKVEIDGAVEYFETLSDAMWFIETHGFGEVTLLCDITNESEIYVYDSEATIDLNGFKLEVEMLVVNEARLTVVDGSTDKTGELAAESIEVYSSTLEILSGKISETYINLIHDESESKLLINGGVFGNLGIRTYSYNEDTELYIGINGGEFDSLMIMQQSLAIVELKGGVFKEGIGMMDFGYSLTLGECLVSDCYGFFGKDGKKLLDKAAEKSMVLSYVEVRHTDTYTLKIDGDKHYEECLCGKTTTPEDHVYDNACDANCNVCDAERTPAAHVYDNACDAKCNVCDAERTPAAHVYDNACDANCNVCDVERTTSAHVYDNACDAKCNVCDAERTPSAHVYDNACDANCNVCDAERTPAAHVYTNDCDSSCDVCGLIREVGAHKFGETVTVTEPKTGKAGEGTITCTVCGESEKVVIPEKGGLPAGATVAITAGSTVAVGTGGFSLLWFVIKKKKWSDLIAIFKG